MKKFLYISIFMLTAFVMKSYAGDIVSPLKGQPESWYDVAHSTVAISSQTVATDAAVTGYRAVYLYNLNATTTIYYTLSTSTQNVTTLGWPIFPYRSTTIYPQAEKIEYNGQINYRVAPGAVGSIDVTKKIIRK